MDTIVFDEDLAAQENAEFEDQLAQASTLFANTIEDLKQQDEAQQKREQEYVHLRNNIRSAGNIATWKIAIMAQWAYQKIWHEKLYCFLILLLSENKKHWRLQMQSCLKYLRKSHKHGTLMSKLQHTLHATSATFCCTSFYIYLCVPFTSTRPMYII